MTARFYKTADVAPCGAGFAVTLDGRALKTPAKAPFVTPTRRLAEAAAAEWRAQSDVVKPETMPLTRLANVALDHTARARADIAAQIARFGETDLLCHRADQPASLADRQAGLWDPLLGWADTELGVSLVAGPGIFAHDQPAGALAQLAARALGLDDFRLTGLARAAGLAGSAIIAFALTEGRLSGRQAFEAAALDDLYQLEVWGEDAEARARLDNQEAELLAIEHFFIALT